MTKPDTITVVTKAKEEIDADAADVYFAVVGSSLFSGEEAFKKAQEVKQLTSLLMDAGIEENRIKLRSVQVDSSSFAILKTSSASYYLKIAKVDLEKLPEILGIIGSQKNCKMNRLEWIYGRQEEVRKALRTQALQQAIELAQLDAEVLGVQIQGIYNLEETARNDSVSREYIGADDEYALFAQGKRNKGTVDLGVALGNATNARVTLKAEFRVSAFEGS